MKQIIILFLALLAGNIQAQEFEKNYIIHGGVLPAFMYFRGGPDGNATGGGGQLMLTYVNDENTWLQGHIGGYYLYSHPSDLAIMHLSAVAGYAKDFYAFGAEFGTIYHRESNTDNAWTAGVTGQVAAELSPGFCVVAQVGLGLIIESQSYFYQRTGVGVAIQFPLKPRE